MAFGAGLPGDGDPVLVDPLMVDPLTVDPLTVDPLTVDPLTVDPVTVDPLTVDLTATHGRSETGACDPDTVVASRADMASARGPWAVVLVGITSAALGHAQPNPPETKPALPTLIGAVELIKFAPATGFIDDVIASDGDRLAYVVADAASKSELHLVTLSTKAEVVVDIASVALHPIALEIVGPRLFVVARLEDGKQVAALVELADKGKAKPAGTVVYKLGPATHITTVSRDGKSRIAVHREVASKAGTRHDIELVAIDTGRRIGVTRSLELDAAGTSKQLDFRVNHWSDGWTRAHGIKGGDWDKKENQRTPDVEATYDAVGGKIVERTNITDLFEQRRRFQALTDAAGRIDFVRIGWDAKTLQIWKGGRLRVIELDQPIASYDPKSLQGIVKNDGSAWLALKVDPVNADAIARKKADSEYLDIFRVLTDGKAVRKVRVLATGLRHRFGVAGDKPWLVERNQGFERGGKSLTLYQLQ